jgi:hypothetical protein
MAGAMSALHQRTPTDASERSREIAEILAGGLIRMRGRMSSQKSADVGEISLDCGAQRSGPKTDSRREVQP